MGSKIKWKCRADTSSSSSTSGNDSDTSSDSRRCRDHKKDRRSCDRSSRREKKWMRRERRERRKREKERKSSKGKKKMDYDFESGSRFGSRSGGEERLSNDPEAVVAKMLKEFPNIGDDLKQLLQMIDDGQVVDIKGISEKSLIKHLNKLFVSLNLNENGDKVFLLPPRFHPTLEVIEPLIQAHVESKEQLPNHLIPSQRDDMSASR